MHFLKDSAIGRVSFVPVSLLENEKVEKVEAQYRNEHVNIKLEREIKRDRNMTYIHTC